MFARQFKTILYIVYRILPLILMLTACLFGKCAIIYVLCRSPNMTISRDKNAVTLICIHRIHKWRTRGKKLVLSHESEALEDKRKLQMKTFSELAECLARIPPKITLYGLLFKSPHYEPQRSGS